MSTTMNVHLAWGRPGLAWCGLVDVPTVDVPRRRAIDCRRCREAAEDVARREAEAREREAGPGGKDTVPVSLPGAVAELQ